MWIVRQNFDYYYEESYKDGPEELNSGGELFQIVFAFDGIVRSVAPAKLTIQEAVFDAESRLQDHQLTWSNHRLQKLYNARYYSLAAN